MIKRIFTKTQKKGKQKTENRKQKDDKGKKNTFEREKEMIKGYHKNKEKGIYFFEKVQEAADQNQNMWLCGCICISIYMKI